jgi:hypothetical protein
VAERDAVVDKRDAVVAERDAVNANVRVLTTEIESLKDVIQGLEGEKTQLADERDAVNANVRVLTTEIESLNNVIEGLADLRDAKKVMESLFQNYKSPRSSSSSKDVRKRKRPRQETDKLDGGVSWLSEFESALPGGYVVKRNDPTSSITIQGPDVSLAVRPLKRGVYKFRGEYDGDVMELVWADSRKSLKVARHLAKSVDVGYVVNLSPSPPVSLRKYMSSVDVFQHVGNEWVSKRVLMLIC